MKEFKAVMVTVWVIILIVGFVMTLANLIQLESMYWLRIGVLLILVGLPTIYLLIKDLNS